MPPSHSASGPGSKAVAKPGARRTRPRSAAPTAPATPADALSTTTVAGLHGRSYPVRIYARTHTASCYDHANGTPVVHFLIVHPCQGLDRVLGTTEVDGRPVGFDEASTSFVSSTRDPYAAARAFRALVQRDGTGGFDDLLADGDRLPAGPTTLPAPDVFVVLGQDSDVSTWDVWYLDRPTPAHAAALERIAQALYPQI